MYKPSARGAEIARQLQCAYIGVFEIPLDRLSFGEPHDVNERRPDGQRVEKLFGRFEEGCPRHQTWNQIPAVLSGNTPPEVRSSSSSTTYWRSDRPIACLQGRHRVAAANDFEIPNQRCVVQLYTDGGCPSPAGAPARTLAAQLTDQTGLHSDARAFLRHNDARSTVVNQGTILRNICRAKRNDDHEAQSYWEGLLDTDSQRKNARRLWMFPIDFCEALGVLTSVEALWHDMTLGTVPSIAATRAFDVR